MRRKMLVPDLYIIHWNLDSTAAYKKKSKTWKKKLPFILCNFSVRTLQCFQKKNFTHENIKKKRPQKLLIIGPNLFFHSPAQPTANSPKSIFHIIKMSLQASVLLIVLTGYKARILNNRFWPSKSGIKIYKPAQVIMAHLQ